MKRFRTVPWQRNLRVIPPEILAKLESSPNSDFIAGVVKTISPAAVQAGLHSHLGFTIKDGVIGFKDRVLPEADMGKYSRDNRIGWEVLRKDLPMVWKTYSHDAPNFGDWTNGSHTVEREREVYQRDYFDPTEFDILITKLRDGKNGETICKFTVDCKFDRNAADFNDSLLFVLNLLQENLGDADILSPTAQDEELLSTLIVDWEIFPPGTVDEVVQRMIKGRRRHPTAQEEATMHERVKLFSGLKPKCYIQGGGGLNHYIGALFDNDLVVFENVRYGNALYVLHEKWEEISKRPRISLLRNRDVPFDRFVHSEGWKQRFNAHINVEKSRRGLKE